MKYGALLSWGIVIYAVSALAWTGLSIYGLAGSIFSLILQVVVLIIVTTIAGRALRFNLWPDILPYSLAWAVIAFFLDILYNVPFYGWGIFSNWILWVGYALIVLIPLMAPKTRSQDQTTIA